LLVSAKRSPVRWGGKHSLVLQPKFDSGGAEGAEAPNRKLNKKTDSKSSTAANQSKQARKEHTP